MRRENATLLVGALLLLSATSRVSAQEAAFEPRARDVLEASAAACSRLQAVEYRVEWSPLPGTVPRLRAQVRQMRRPGVEMGPLPGHYSVEGVTEPWFSEDETHTVPFAYAYDGQDFRSLDFSGRAVEVLEDPSPERISRLPHCRPAGLPEFSSDRPFARDLEHAERVTHEGQFMVGDTFCDVIRIQARYAELPGFVSVVDWAIGVEDDLPRARDGMTCTNLMVRDGDSAPSCDLPDWARRYETKSIPDTHGLLRVGARAPDVEGSGTSEGGDPARSKIGSDRLRLIVFLDGSESSRRFASHVAPLYGRSRDDGLLVVALVGLPDAAWAGALQKSIGGDCRMRVDDGALARSYRVVDRPTWYLVSRRGMVLRRESGFRRGAFSELDEILRVLP